MCFPSQSCKYSQREPPTPRQRHRLRRKPHTGGTRARRRPDKPRVGRERPRRPRAAPGPRQGGLSRLILPGTGPSPRGTQTLTPLAIAHGRSCQRKGKRKGSPPPSPPLSPPLSQGQAKKLAPSSLSRVHLSPSCLPRRVGGGLGRSQAPCSAFHPAVRGVARGLCVSRGSPQCCLAVWLGLWLGLWLHRRLASRPL